MKKTSTLSKLLVALLCAALLVSSLGFGRSTPADQYEDAIELLQAGKYSEAAPAFKALGHYQDAGEYAMYAGALAEAEKGNYTLAATTMATLGDFMDSALMSVYFTGRGYESRQRYEDAEDIYATILLFKDVQERVGKLPELILQRDYAEADNYEKCGDQTSDSDSKRSLYAQAKSAFGKLGSYSDSVSRVSKLTEKINAVDYAEADAMEKEGMLQDAYDAFVALGSYSDSADRAAALKEQICAKTYEAACAREDAGDLQGAYNAYVSLGDYLDARDRAAALKNEANYRQAYTFAENGSYNSARDAYLALGDYKDSAEKARLMGIPALAENTKRVAPGVYAFKMNKQWGLISLGDNLDIKPSWSSIDNFNTNGLAVAAMGSKYGLIDLKGETVLPMNYASIEAGRNGYYTAAVTDTNSWWGSYVFSLIGPDGRVISSGWDQLGRSSGSRVYAPEFTSDTIICENNKGYALLHKDGTILLEKQNSLSYLQLSNGEYALDAKGSDKLWRFYRLDGTALTDDAWADLGTFSGGYAPVKSQDGQWGFIRQSDCQVAIAPAYTEVRAFREGYAAVKVGRLWGFIDQKGEMVIEAKYTSASDFSGGMSTVSNSLLGEHIIGKDGELIYYKETIYDLAADYDADEQYEDAIEAFEALNGYADSDARALQARDKVNLMVYARAEELEKQGRLLEAAETFDWLGAYADAPQRAAAARETLSANTWASAEKLEAEGKLEEAIAIYLTLGEYRGAAQHAADLREGINLGIMAEAEALANEQKYEAAIKALSVIPDYKDVSERIAAYKAAIPVRDYNAAAALENEGKFEEAIAAFTAMNGYSDTAARIDALHEKIRQRDYGYAAFLESEGSFEKAIEAFAAMNGYADSADRILRLRELIKERDYKIACQVEAEGDYTRAFELFTALGNFSDSQARAQAVTEKAEEQKRQQAYNEALALKDAGKLNEALNAFKALGNYSNSLDFVALLEENIRANSYNEAMQLLAEERYEDALKAFRALGSYSDSAAKAQEARKGIDYAAAFKLATGGKFKESSLAFSKLGNFKDSQQKAAATGMLSTEAYKTTKVAEGVYTYQKGNSNGLWGIANLNTNVVADAKYNKITVNAGTKYQPLTQANKFGLLAVYINPNSKVANDYQKTGYIDYNGREVVPCIYYSVSDFSADGYCTVVTYEPKDRQEKQYTWSSSTRTVTYSYFYFGIMNSSGQTITKAQWRTADSSSNSNWGKSGSSNRPSISVPQFTNGFMRVQTPDGTWGFIDKNGKVVGGTSWKAVKNFSNGMAVVHGANGYTFINEEGVVIGANAWATINDFSNGMAAVLKDGKWGFINKQNELVIPCQYKQVNSFKSDGTCEVQTTSGTWIVIDKQGNTAFFGN